MEDNLKLWKLVEKTNPNYTKEANVKGNRITSIAPQFQILNATEQFGIYGVTWGFKHIEIDYTLVPVCGLIYWSAIFFFPNGEFPATNSISIWRDGVMTKPDDQFAKKVETDSLTKCLSKLGFNADIFLGKFDNDRYLEEVTKEFSIKVDHEGDLNKCKSLEELKKAYGAMSTEQQEAFKSLKDKLKLELK